MFARMLKGTIWLVLGFFVLALVIPAQAADISFTGTVSWRERIALPAQSTLTVSLVALPEGNRVAHARASLGDKAGSPIQFTLNVRSNVMRPDRQYGLVAEIWQLGYPIFTNVQPVPVDLTQTSGITIPVQNFVPPPHDPPAQILPPVETPNPLLDLVWTVTSIGGDPVTPPGSITLSIAADHRVGGNGGCNSYFAEADFSGPPLSFSPIAGTKMACDAATMAQEQRFFAALGATMGYELSGTALKLVDAAGIPLMGLVRRP